MNDALEPYRPHIDKLDLTEDEKLELVNTIENIAKMVLDKELKLSKQKR